MKGYAIMADKYSTHIFLLIMNAIRCIAFTLLAALLLTVGAGAINFADVSPRNPYHDAVQWAYEQGVVSGTSNSTFAPDRKITADEFMAMFIRAYHPEFKYTGIGNNSWSKFYVDCGGKALCLYNDEEYAAMKQHLSRQKVWDIIISETNFSPYPAWMYNNDAPSIDFDKDIENAMYMSGLYTPRADASDTPTRGEVVNLIYRLQNHLYAAQELPAGWTFSIKIQNDAPTYSWRARNIILHDWTKIPDKFIQMLQNDGWTLRLVNRIPDYYDIDNRSIGVCSFSNQTIAIGNPAYGNIRGTILHEVGHAVAFTEQLSFFEHHMYQEVDAVAQVLGTSYCRTNSDEMFAEAFRYILSNLDSESNLKKLKDAAPYTYRAIKDAIIEAPQLCDKDKLNELAAYYWDYLYNGAEMPPET